MVPWRSRRCILLTKSWRASDVPDLPAKPAKADTKELKLATQIIDSLSGPWKPARYHDTYTEEVQKLIRAHEKGKDVVVEEPPAAQAQVIDLMEALQASVKATTSRGSRKKALSKAATQLAKAAEREDNQKRPPRKSASASKRRSGRARASKSRSSRQTSTKKAPSRKSA